MSKLTELGFEGDIKWVHNEEGSGAKFFKSSVYFPDSLVEPRTKSGITIDPGVDLGNASASLVREVINYYASQGLLSVKQKSLLNECLGMDTYSSITWLKNNRKYFKGNFLVPDDQSLLVMENYTAPQYWIPLIGGIPELLNIRTEHIAKAVHTALLSMSYNRGPRKTISLVKEFIKVKNYEALAKKINSVFHSLDSLKARRKREAQLISDAIKQKKEFKVVPAEEINPAPLTVIGGDFIDSVEEKIHLEMKNVQKPEGK